MTTSSQCYRYTKNKISFLKSTEGKSMGTIYRNERQVQHKIEVACTFMENDF